MEPVPDRASIPKSQRWFQCEFLQQNEATPSRPIFSCRYKKLSDGNIALDFLVFYVYRSAPCCPGEGGGGQSLI